MARIAGHCDDFHYRGAFNPRQEIAIWSVDVAQGGDHAFCLHGQVPIQGVEQDLRVIEIRIHEAVEASIRGGSGQIARDEPLAWSAFASALIHDGAD
ncbi:hypothetical protein [Dyella sp. C11]|uniref:hypothetical protein n=1 Tax=Dyella sp. C11 TaxID=2126991 RepID=UPI000D646443|nr:hypothetical protein [Dyella sp. C11]